MQKRAFWQPDGNGAAEIMCDRSSVIASAKQGSSALAAAAKPHGRARVTNGSELLVGIDGRSRPARRYRDVLDALLAQLGREPTEADLILARRAAHLVVWCEAEDAALARGETAAETVTAANALRRLLSDLGMTAVHRARGRRNASQRPALAGVAAS